MPELRESTERSDISRRSRRRNPSTLQVHADGVLHADWGPIHSKYWSHRSAKDAESITCAGSDYAPQIQWLAYETSDGWSQAGNSGRNSIQQGYRLLTWGMKTTVNLEEIPTNAAEFSVKVSTYKNAVDDCAFKNLSDYSIPTQETMLCALSNHWGHVETVPQQNVLLQGPTSYLWEFVLMNRCVSGLESRVMQLK